MLHLHTTEGPDHISLPFYCESYTLTQNITSYLSQNPPV